MKLGQGILGATIDHLREARRGGTRVSRLVAELRGQGMEIRDIADHLAAAFLLTGQANIALIPKDASGEPDPAILDDYIAECVDAKRLGWEQAPAYPDVFRRRDRIAFQQTAREHQIILVVCAPDRHGPRAAGYRIHGAYRARDGANAWTAAAGETLRAELNRRLGADLIAGGPHDTWAERTQLDESDPRRGPQPPVLFFLPDGDVQVRFDARGMERYYRFLEIDWDEYYSTPLEQEEGD
jgi:hypothetical protein